MTLISGNCTNMLIKHVAGKISGMQRTIWKHFLSINSDGFPSARTLWKQWGSCVLFIRHLKMRNARHFLFRKDVRTPTGRIFWRFVWIMSFVEVVIICFLEPIRIILHKISIVLLYILQIQSLERMETLYRNGSKSTSAKKVSMRIRTGSFFFYVPFSVMMTFLKSVRRRLLTSTQCLMLHGIS